MGVPLDRQPRQCKEGCPDDSNSAYCYQAGFGDQREPIVTMIRPRLSTFPLAFDQSADIWGRNTAEGES